MVLFSSVKALVTRVVQKRLLSTSTSVGQLQNPPLLTVEYLINTCGFSSKSALLITRKLKLDDDETLQNAHLVLNYLKSNGFEETHIAKLIKKHPKIITYGVENNLKPKVDFFTQNGFKGTHLADLFVTNPTICYRSLSDEIKPSFDVLKELLGISSSSSSEDVYAMKAMKRWAWFIRGSVTDNLKSNVDFLIQEGVPARNVSKLAMYNPVSVMKRPDNFVRDVKAVKELGINPKTLKFIHALRMMVQMTESTLSKKIQLFESLGWTVDETLSIFKRSPVCFCCSKEKIRNNMRFFTDTFKVDLEFIIANPVLLTYSMDRMSKRFKILKVLESNELLKWDNKLARAMTKTEDFFLKRYVDKYEKNVPGLLKMYNGTLEAEKINDSMAENLRVSKS
ncbi:hypothetical protein ACFE04_009988 [Oxalis oulophora]